VTALTGATYQWFATRRDLRFALRMTEPDSIGTALTISEACSEVSLECGIEIVW